MFRPILSRVAVFSLLSLVILASFKEVLAAETPRVSRSAREQLDQLDYFQGTWHCKGKQNELPPFSNEFKFIWKVERRLNDWWFFGQEDPPTKDSAQTEARTQELWGYDAGLKQFTRIIATIEGRLFKLTSSGWQAGKPNEIVWDGDRTSEFDGKQRWRKVVIKKSETEFEVTNDIWLDSEGPAGWQLESVELCRKQKASRPVN
ncbi:MAG: hypothetical protein KME42_17190 [Tildeniella nuda ZEHNDER 1965/U140]|jgi:hypothetical protein|nr:hypothetical protein [Tildeniella nuda ZEHNDER 1965/U140]